MKGRGFKDSLTFAAARRPKTIVKFLLFAIKPITKKNAPSAFSVIVLRIDSTNRTGWPLIFAMISYDKKMKNQIGYRVSLHDEYDEG